MLDLTGKRIGVLTVLSRAGRRAGQAYWLCRCDCGIEREIHMTVLQRATVTCISYRSKLSRRTNSYGSWYAMKARCYNPNDSHYADYGGRGITVCLRWRHSFDNFFADMGNRPTNKHSIERIDNSGNYGPSNCRWATQREQCRNRRDSRLLTYQGKTLPLAEWAERVKLPATTIQVRLDRLGWTLKETLSIPRMATGTKRRYVYGA